MCNEYRFKQSLDHLADAFSQLNVAIHWAGGAPNLEPRLAAYPRRVANLDSMVR